MKQLDPAQWSVVSEALDTLLGLPVDKQQAALDALDLDEEITALVRQMLAADAATGSVLDQPAKALLDEDEPSRATIPADLTGRLFGPYEVVSEIGRGGMGAVLRARRADGEFDKDVAVKLIRPGRYTDAMKERFRLEMRTLATLEHPNIAHLIDGGIGPDEIPFFVMELVEGTPITDYCDQQGLSIEQRIVLFRQVCDGVAYAHSKLIVHGDLKPSNILVTEGGQVKLVDFGIARNLAEEAVVELPRVTPQYAAPEQFSKPIGDTRADVFGLAGTLYHLLCGSPPRKTQLAEITLASQRLADTELDAEKIAEARGASRSGLRKALEGELDCLLAAGLAIDPALRLPSAQSLRQELDRFIGFRPLESMPDSARYRLSKYLQRHRTGAVLGTIALLAVLSASLVAVWQAREAKVQAQREATVRAFLEDTFNSVSPLMTQGDEVSARQLIDGGMARLESDASLLPAATVAELQVLFGDMYYDLGDFREAVRAYASAEASQASLPTDLQGQVQSGLGNAHLSLGQYEQAKTSLRNAVELASFDRFEPYALRALTNLGYVFNQTGDPAQAEVLLRDAQSRFQALVGAGHTHPDSEELIAHIKQNLSIVISDRGKHADGIALGLEALEHYRNHWGTEHHPTIASVLNALSSSYRVLGELEKSEDAVTRSLEIKVAIFGEDHPDTLIQRMNFASHLVQAQPERALAESQRILDALSQPGQPAYPWECLVVHTKGRALEGLRRFDESIEPLRVAAQLALERLGPTSYRVGHYRVALGRALWKQGDLAGATAAFDSGIASLQEVLDADHPRLLTAQTDQIVFLTAIEEIGLRDELWSRLHNRILESQGPESELLAVLAIFGGSPDSDQLEEAMTFLAGFPKLSIRGYEYELAQQLLAQVN